MNCSAHSGNVGIVTNETAPTVNPPSTPRDTAVITALRSGAMTMVALSRAEAAWDAARPSHIQNAMPALSMPRGGVPFLAYHIPSGDCVAHGVTLIDAMVNARLAPSDLEVLRMHPLRAERTWFRGSRLKQERIGSETVFRGTACRGLNRHLEMIEFPAVAFPIDSKDAA